MRDLRARSDPVSSLPNVHPLLVHFPLALAFTALGLDVFCLTLRRPWLDRATVTLYGLAAVSGVVTAISGKVAFEGFAQVSARAESVAGEHSDWAFLSIILLFVVLVLRFEALWRDRAEAVVRRAPIRWLALVLSIGAQVALFETASHGGELVFRHGLGVSGPMEASPPPEFTTGDPD